MNNMYKMLLVTHSVDENIIHVPIGLTSTAKFPVLLSP